MGLLHEFKNFAMRGNVIDLAVGVVIGGAFGKIVTALVGEVIMPALGALTRGVDVSKQYFYLGRGEDPGTLEKVKAAGEAYFGWGPFLQSVIDFAIVAFAIFLVVKAINAARARFDAKQEKPSAAPTEEVLLLREIRDALARR
ncbi:MAG TPA: large conductance mechanosensitive channel protein MscL [Lacipirellulaceae bacterium]|nr:large conductance mechanosensitive channel protein MscL [Lacipirellulaceae bacterium]